MGSAYSHETNANKGFESDSASKFQRYQSNINKNSELVKESPMPFDAENGNMMEYNFRSQEPWAHVEYETPKESVKTYFVPNEPQTQEIEETLTIQLQNESAKRFALEDRLVNMNTKMENIQQENATLKSRLRILNEVIFDEQEKALIEENKRKVAEQKCRLLEEKLRRAEDELTASRSVLTEQNVIAVDSDSASDTEIEMDCSSDSEDHLTIRCILERVPVVNIEDPVQAATNLPVRDSSSLMGEHSNVFGPEASTRYQTKNTESSNPGIPANDSGIEFDLQTSEADTDVGSSTDPKEKDEQSDRSTVTSRPVVQLEEENKQLQYHLECTNNELVRARLQMSELDARLQEVEEDRARLIKRVTGLFRSKNATEEQYRYVRDLMRRLKEHLVEVQSNATEMEEGYMGMIQKMVEDKRKMIQRGKKRLNKFRNSRQLNLK